MFGDKVSDDWIYGRIFFDIWWVNKYNIVLEKMIKNMIVYFFYDINVYIVFRILLNFR